MTTDGGAACSGKGPATTGGARSEFPEAGAVVGEQRGKKENEADWEREQQ